MTISRIEHKHGRRWFWSGDRIRFIEVDGQWRKFTWMRTKFDPRRMP